MKQLEKLLQLIETGKVERMHLDENQNKNLRELMDYGLISVSEDKIELTPKGIAANQHGIGHLLEEEQLHTEMLFDRGSLQRSKRNFMISLMSLVIAFLLLIGFLLQ